MKFKSEAGTDKVIRNLVHGRKNLYPVNGLSPSKVHILVAGLLGLGMGIAGLFIDFRDGTMRTFRLPWKSEQCDSFEDLRNVAGLQNLGNNCFLNVILQALASCSCFISSLQSILAADGSDIEERAEDMPLSVALVSLLEDLQIFWEARTTLSPRQVMLGMSLYVARFNLMRQQDAAEALVHLLSSLSEEFSRCYIPHFCSLADACALHCRISRPNTEGKSMLELWRQKFVGPFDGTIGSTLTCRNCSSTISMDFEFFHCLPLSAVLDRNNRIMDGCTVTDCLKQFTAAEHLESYRCIRCWHITALRRLSLKSEENEEKLEILRRCLKLESCDCKRLLLCDGLSISDVFTDSFKQLTIAHCPKILCIHLQRASMDEHGESIKLQGHISFPFVLDLFPFTAPAMKMRLKTTQEDMQWKVEQMQRAPTPLIMQWKMQMIPQMYESMGDQDPLETLSGNKLLQTISQPSDGSVTHHGGDKIDANVSECRIVPSHLNKSQSCSIPESRIPECYTDSRRFSGPSKNDLYRLTSVIEHHGRSGSGHYTVYRSLFEPEGEDNLERLNKRWFYASDCEVSSVSEETVLAAEASLLFYEKIEDCM